MTKKEIKTIIKNYNKDLKIADIDIIKGMDILIARAVVITEFHTVDRISFYNDGTFSIESLYERFSEKGRYYKTEYYI